MDVKAVRSSSALSRGKHAGQVEIVLRQVRVDACAHVLSGQGGFQVEVQSGLVTESAPDGKGQAHAVIVQADLPIHKKLVYARNESRSAVCLG